MPAGNQLINAKFASDATGKVTTIPDKKCITYIEMQTLVPRFTIDLTPGKITILNLTGVWSLY